MISIDPGSHLGHICIQLSHHQLEQCLSPSLLLMTLMLLRTTAGDPQDTSQASIHLFMQKRLTWLRLIGGELSYDHTLPQGKTREIVLRTWEDSHLGKCSSDREVFQGCWADVNGSSLLWLPVLYVRIRVGS
jgi:hypothetical protein